MLNLLQVVGDLNKEASMGYFKFSVLVACTKMVQTCGASFHWAVGAIVLRADELGFSEDQVKACWSLLLQNASPLLSQKALDLSKGVKGFGLQHNLAIHWNGLINELRASAPEMIDKPENTAKRVFEAWSNEWKTPQAKETPEQIKIEDLKKANENNALPSEFVKLKSTNLAKIGQTQKETLAGCFETVAAIATSASKLLDAAKSPATWIRVKDRGIVTPNMMRWFLTVLSEFQSQWVQPESPPKGYGSRGNRTFSSFFKLSSLLSFMGAAPPAWNGKTPPKFYAWPALVQQGRYILKYWRERYHSGIKLDTGIDLTQVFPSIDLNSCTEYELAVLMEINPQARLFAHYDEETSEWVLKKVTGYVGSTDLPTMPILLAKRQPPKIPGAKVPPSSIPEHINPITPRY
eukprot:Protomagalhaensia_wolfi_Nauph_80__4602@NODE_474_length_2461_cov_12_488852_g357_i0_p1_GENE_NODE_474_length_2461_cov_12_488852_g357_i0NODE_474_length_2461_cov_12_488852_g357_i0_p1_ORF_typecomplete_len467_score75_23_NODE_474_length_2461_cov_12_488852_g357_i01861403